MAAPAYCPSCGRPQTSDAQFCATCGQAFGPGGSATQQLAGAAMSAQTVNLVSWLGGIAGGLVFLLVGAWLVFDRYVLGEEPGLAALLPFVAGFVGLFVGSRTALAMLSR